MSSWSLLLALSGFQCDVGRGQLTFVPVVEASSQNNFFKTFWSCGWAWGVYEQRFDHEQGVWIPSLKVLGGDLDDRQAVLRVTACGREFLIEKGSLQGV